MNIMEKEFKDLFLGERIGFGASREVFNHRQDDSLVVKVEEGAKKFQNVLEWEIWQRVKETPLSKWFAPCEDISPSGLILIQRKTSPVRKDDCPVKLPFFFTDFKIQNYGRLGKHFVCHDYGTSLLIEYGMTKRLKTVQWWSENDL